MFPAPNLRFAHGEEDLSTTDKPIRVPSWVLKQVEDNEIKIIVDAAEGAEAEDPKSGALGTPLGKTCTPCWSPPERCSSSRCSQSQWPALSRAATREAEITRPASPMAQPSPSPSDIMGTFHDISSSGQPAASSLFASPLLNSSANGDVPAARRELFPPSAPMDGLPFPQYHGQPKAAAAPPPLPTAPPALLAMRDEPGRAEVEPARRELSSSGCGAGLDLPWAWDGSKYFANPNLPIDCVRFCLDLAPPPPNAGHLLEPPPAPAEYLAACLGLQLQREQHTQLEQYQQQYQQLYQQQYQQHYQQQYQHAGELYEAQQRRVQLCRLVASAF